jgi:hypothetical protein
MSFEGYLRTIRERTGLETADFIRLGTERGLIGPDLNAGDVISWMAADYGLGRGHAMAIVSVLKGAVPTGAQVEKVFAGPRQIWRPTYDRLLQHVQALGDDTGVQPTKQYVSFTREGRKFAIVQPTGTRFDVGLKLDPGTVLPGLSPAGSWNSMMTHRAQIHDEADVDAGLFENLDYAYQHRSLTEHAHPP